MFNLLIVDDEKYSVAGITQGIDWTGMPVENIYEAYSAKQAKELMNNVNVDLLISDIEMPGDNGIQLLEWTREHFPETETIFLTGHANFSYAQQAVHLGSYEYIVKPIDYEELKRIVSGALKEISDKREAREYQETYRRYHDRWVQQKPLLIERFWQDLLSQRIASSQGNIDEAIHLYNLPLTSNQKVLPVLISVEQWSKELDTRDEEIMEYAIRNSALEILLAEERGAVLQDRSGVNVALLYDGLAEVDGMERLKDRCKMLLEAAKRYFYCEISCYIGEETVLSRLSVSYRALLEQEQDNVAESNNVFTREQSADRTMQAVPFAPFDDWLVLFESGNKQELLKRLDDTVNSIRERDTTADTVDMLTTSIKHLLYRSFHRQGLPMFGGFVVKGGIRSLTQFHSWAQQTVEEAFEVYHAQVADTRAVIDKIHQYVSQHLMEEELKREDIAKHVFLNPAYLSRLYKKETGIALSDYIMHARVDKSKSYLANTDRKVSDIAVAVGYANLSHFAKVFRKIVGVGPKEYRQKFNK
ncbi:response regulator [Paenibacillus sp. OV219]|uniref:response regulator transcription factor n=1 Tax=Paenibacillus sp. OV219 TaxID=1884377 RepID=UPI0008BE6ABD|nr:response regulator [Paenibacillus sp. OV219]SEO90895.1 two-component system, response regulator YesN [Paenibacillus sp. OV219]